MTFGSETIVATITPRVEHSEEHATDGDVSDNKLFATNVHEDNSGMPDIDETVTYVKPQMHFLPTIANMRNKKERQDELEHERKLHDNRRKRAVSKWQSAITVVAQLREEEDRLAAKARELQIKYTAETETKSTTGKTRQEIRAGIFPAECRNTFTLRRFVDKEVEHVLKTRTPETIRRDKVQRILNNTKFPELVKRDKSTSAIFRNFNRYKNTSAYRRNNKHGHASLSVDMNELSLQVLRKKYKELNEMKTGSSSSSLMNSAYGSPSGRYTDNQRPRKQISFLTDLSSERTISLLKSAGTDRVEKVV